MMATDITIARGKMQNRKIVLLAASLLIFLAFEHWPVEHGDSILEESSKKPAGRFFVPDNASSDINRPRYHYTPGNWMNDPIPFFWDGVYHIFYQSNPHQPYWITQMEWGHIVSKDLVHWEYLSQAIVPGPGFYDMRGEWTGSVARDEENTRFVMMYTGINIHSTQTQNLAFSDDLVTWRKYEGNPVLKNSAASLAGFAWRDPYLWHDDAENVWYVIIGADYAEGPNRGGAIMLYRSSDLLSWQYVKNLLADPTPTFGSAWECPDLFSLSTPSGQKSTVLLFSRGPTWWRSGRYDRAQHRFFPKQSGATDHGNFYAAKTLLDSSGRRFLFGWVTDGAKDPSLPPSDWSGVLSLPRLMSLSEDGRIAFTAPKDLLSLRSGSPWQSASVKLSADAPFVVPGIQGHEFEVLVSFKPQDGLLALRFRCDENGEGGVEIAYTPEMAKELLGTAKLATMQVFVDHSVVEAFIDDRIVFTTRHYLFPDQKKGFNRIALVAPGDMLVDELSVWTLAL